MNILVFKGFFDLQFVLLILFKFFKDRVSQAVILFLIIFLRLLVCRLGVIQVQGLLSIC